MEPLRQIRRPIPPPAEFADDSVAWAMWLYYVEGKTQNEVAQHLGVSRASVANYLAEARRRGLVAVTVPPGLLSNVTLGRRLAERFGLAGAHVVPDTGADGGELRRRLGLAGAQVLLPRLAPDTVLGVAWGRTMLALAQAIPEREMGGMRVVQVSGSSLGGEMHAPEFCTALIASRLGARGENLHAPAILSTGAMRDALMKEPGISRQLARVRRCGMAVFGVGELDDFVVFSDADFLSEEVVEAYMARGAVAVVLGRFLDAGGREVEGPLSGRQMGMELDELRAVPVRIAVAGGARKLGAIRALLAGGYATDLVTDAATARALTEDA